MSFNSTWLTQEPPILIHVETVIMVCTLLGTIAYGCNIAVYLSTMHAIWTSPVKRHLWLSTIFTTGIFAFSTLFLVWDVTAIQYAFVEYRNFPGGPAAFYPIMASLEGSRYDFGNFSAVIISWSSDAMLLWRCYTVWSKRIVIVVVPVILWIGSVVTGSITCYQAARPMGNLESLGAFNFNLSFWAISLSLNMLLTGLILARLLSARSRAIATLGAEHGKTYTGIAAIMIESALLYAIVGFVFIVTYGVNSLDGLVLQQVLVQIEAISPQLIVLRIARGRAWTNQTSAEITASKTGEVPLRFAVNHSRADASQTFNDSRGGVAMTTLRSKGSVGTIKHDV